MVYAVRSAKKGGTRAAALGSALMLMFSFGMSGDPRQQQRIEEAREDKGKKGAESGDPP